MFQVKKVSVALVCCLLPLAIGACGGNEPDAPIQEPATDPARTGEPVSDPIVREIQGADPADRMGGPAPDSAMEASNDEAGADQAEGNRQAHSSEDDRTHDHNGAGGEAHTHGDAEAAIVIEGRDLTISLSTALASFGGSEAEPTTAEETAAREALRAKLITPLGMVDPIGDAGCIFAGSDVSFRHSGNHGDVDITYDFQCSSPESLEGVAFDMFAAFETLEAVEVAMLSGTAQSAVDVTPGSPIARFER